jgi:uncharacterized cupredoxin-like copper-binding protein
MLNKINKRWLMMLLVSILISMLVAASPLSAQGEEEIKIKIFLDDYFFQLEEEEENAPIILKVGQKVEIEFENIGFDKHEVRFGKRAIFEEDMPPAYRENLLQGVEVEIRAAMNGKGLKIESLDLIYLELEPEAKLKVEFTVPGDRVGEWELGCFLPGHYETMHLLLLIEE